MLKDWIEQGRYSIILNLTSNCLFRPLSITNLIFSRRQCYRTARGNCLYYVSPQCNMSTMKQVQVWRLKMHSSAAMFSSAPMLCCNYYVLLRFSSPVDLSAELPPGRKLQNLATTNPRLSLDIVIPYPDVTRHLLPSGLANILKASGYESICKSVYSMQSSCCNCRANNLQFLLLLFGFFFFQFFLVLGLWLSKKASTSIPPSSQRSFASNFGFSVFGTNFYGSKLVLLSTL